MIKIEKKKTHELEKCYSIAPLAYQGKDHILVAAEKVNKCLLFDQEGNLEETVWDGPGGTMSMVQVPGSDGVFLATHKFYSPNDSKEAKIVIVTPAEGGWQVRTLVDLPHVHRFDIISRGGVNYLIAAALCSSRKCKDDWSDPGKVYVAELPEDLSAYHDGNQLAITPIKDNLLKNHGYCRMHDENGDYAVIGTENGIYKMVPPAQKGGEWSVKQLLDEPASDMTLVDFDGDGDLEMLVIAPFHGDEIKIYKLQDGMYRKVYTYEKPAEFAHGIWSGMVYGQPVAIIGHRKAERDLMAFTYDAEKGYSVQILDSDVGPANVFHYKRGDMECLVSTNREIDEIAFYDIVSM